MFTVLYLCNIGLHAGNLKINKAWALIFRNIKSSEGNAHVKMISSNVLRIIMEVHMHFPGCRHSETTYINK